MSEEREKTYTRFSLSQRIEHFLVILSFTILGVTGLPQKYASAGWAETIIAWFGGIENTRRLHHAAAVLLILEAVYHVVAVGYRMYVQGARAERMLPALKDFSDFFGDLRYSLGLQSERPPYDRFNFKEKMEYWAVIWGTTIMVLTGFILWNPIATTRWLSGQVIPMAKAAHGGEALLAVLSIITWHVYHVHIKHFNRSMFTGKMSREEMLEEHPVELARIEAGRAQPPPPEVRTRRRSRYLPLAGVFTVISLFLVYGFVTLETTAIETIPPQPTQVVFERAIPQATPTPVEMLVRSEAAQIPHALSGHVNCLRCHAEGTIRPFPDNHSGLGNARCLNCHEPRPEAEQTAAVGGDVPSFRTDIEPALEEECVACHGVAGGLNLSSYSWLMAGGEDGPAVVRGEPERSLIVQVLEAGHFAELPQETDAALRKWIDLGAPNN